jgi:hypothetical protein
MNPHLKAGSYLVDGLHNYTDTEMQKLRPHIKRDFKIIKVVYKGNSFIIEKKE